MKVYDTPMELIAHRGAPSGKLPENSLAAFREAIRSGLNVMEFDVRTLLDGTLVVLHDKTMKRTVEAPAELREVPVQWLRPEQVLVHRLKGSQEQVPTLAQVLGLLDEFPQVSFMLELKDHHPRAAELALKLLNEREVVERVVIQSFDHHQLHTLTQMSRVSVCPLYRFRPTSVNDLNCAWEAPMAETLLLTPWTVGKAQKLGRKVAPWFAVAEGWGYLRSRMERLGADALMIDVIR